MIKLVTNSFQHNKPRKPQKAVFPQLPVLQAISERIAYDTPDLSEYFLIAGQHALDTTGSLFEWMRDVLNLPMSNVYMVGKSYSTSENVAKKMQKSLKINYQLNSPQIMLGGFSEAYDYDIIKLWEKIVAKLMNLKKKNQQIKGILILDDGGHLFNRMLPGMLSLTRVGEEPIPIIGIEQTSSGVFSSRCFLYPIIEVATSAAKQLEASMLAVLIEKQLKVSVAECLSQLSKGSLPIETTQLTYGIIGLGNIGAVVLPHLQALGYKNLVVYDRNPDRLARLNSPNVVVAENLIDFLDKSDVILGCTGNNFMAPNISECLEILQQPREFPRVFVSLSSKDTEFNSLLMKIHQDNRNGPINPLKHIFYPKQNPQAIILGAGMPLNFIPVNSGECDYSIPDNEIQLTRGLLAAAIIQAYNMMQNGYSLNAKQYQLDPHWQRYIVNAWSNATQQEQIPAFQNLKWIEEQSGGEPTSPDYPNIYFNDNE